MPRTVSTAMLNALKASYLKPALLVSIGFKSSTSYMWSGLGTLVWHSQSWIGIGSLLGVSLLEEGTTVEAKGLTITLSGLDPTLLTECVGDFKLGLPVNVYLGIFDSTGAVIADPLVCWSGFSDLPEIEMSGTTATIALNAESRLLELNVSSDRRYTLEQSQLEAPGDVAFQFVSGIAQIDIHWGGAIFLCPDPSDVPNS
jgi:hypothetical protein